MGSKHSEPASFQRRNASRRQANSTEKFENLIAISERLGEMAHLFPNVKTKEVNERANIVFVWIFDFFVMSSDFCGRVVTGLKAGPIDREGSKSIKIDDFYYFLF